MPRAPFGREALVAAALFCACLPVVPWPAAADNPRMSIASSGGISLASTPPAGNNGYYSVGDTIRVRVRFRDRSHHINFDDRICRAQDAYVNVNIGGTWAPKDDSGHCFQDFEDCYFFRGGTFRRATPLLPSRDNLRGQTRQWGFVDFVYVVRAEDVDHNGIGVPRDGVKGKFWGCDPGGQEAYHSYYYTDRDPELIAALTDQSGHKVDGHYRPVFRDQENRIVRTGPNLVFRKGARVDARAGVNYAVLPRARSGSTLGLVYSVSPSLPGGLRLITDTGGVGGRPVVTGVPSAASARKTYRLRTADRNNRAAELPFTLEVQESPYVARVAMASAPANNDSIYRAGETISVEVAFNQPVKIGSFCILSTCVRTVGLRVAIGGNARIFRYASGDRTRKLTFNYTVQSDDLDTDGIGVLRLVKVPNAQRYIQSVSSGEALADYYYALPGDLSFARNAGHLVIPGAVTFGGRTIASQTLHVARPVRLELPAAAGGIGALSYQLTPALPDGLRWTAPGRGAGHGGVIAGTPRSGTRRAALFALTARDPRGVEASLYFYVHVSTGGTVNDVRIVSTAPGRGYYTKDDIIRLRATFNGDVAGATGPTLKLAVGTTTHTLQNQAPAGSNPKNYLDFSYTVRADDRDTDGVGLPANALGGQVRVNVAGVSGAQNASLSLAALPDQAAHVVRGTQTTPDFGSASVAERTVTPANAVDIALPAATGGEGRVSYALTPAVPGGAPDLPAGLSYASPADAASGGKISGRPAAGKSRTRYTLTATDEDGDTDTVSFFLTATGFAAVPGRDSGSDIRGGP